MNLEIPAGSVPRSGWGQTGTSVVNEGDIVFVEPTEDRNNPLKWAPAMVVPTEEFDKSFITQPLTAEDRLVRYFDSLKFEIINVQSLSPFDPLSELFTSFQKQSNKFLEQQCVKTALVFLRTGRVPQTFQWEKWGISGKYRTMVNAPNITSIHIAKALKDKDLIVSPPLRTFPATIDAMDETESAEKDEISPTGSTTRRKRKSQQEEDDGEQEEIAPKGKRARGSGDSVKKGKEPADIDDTDSKKGTSTGRRGSDKSVSQPTEPTERKRINAAPADPPRGRGRPRNNRRAQPTPPPGPSNTAMTTTDDLFPSDNHQTPTVQLPPGPLVDANGRLLPQAEREKIFAVFMTNAKELRTRYLDLQKAVKTLQKQRNTGERDKARGDLIAATEAGTRSRLAIMEWEQGLAT